MPCPHARPAQSCHLLQRTPHCCTPTQNTRTRALNPNQQGTTRSAKSLPHFSTPFTPMTIRRTIEIAAFCAALLLAALIFHAWLAAHDDQLRLSSTLATQKQALDAADARERDRNATLKDALAQIDALKRSAQNETPAQLARALQDALQLPQPITIGSASPSDSSVGARHVEDPASVRGAVPERPNSTAAPVSNDAHAPDVPTAAVSPAPPPPPTTQLQDPKNSQPETQRHKSLLDSLFHRTPRTQAAATSTLPSPGTQSGTDASPQNQQGTGASLPVLTSTPLKPASSGSAANPPQSTAEIPAADLAPLYNYVQDCRACQLELTAAKQNASDDAAKIRALTRERDAAVTASKGGPFWLRLKRNAHWLAVGAAIGAVTSTAALCHTGHCR